MPTDRCPTTAEYQAMLRGELDESRSAEAESHLDACSACQRLLDSLAVDDRLTEALRAGPVRPAADAPDLSGMISRIEEMASQFTPAGFDLSASANGEEATRGYVTDATTIGPLGAYRVIRLLGAGGMGLVYLAEDEMLHRQVAVKILPPRLARRSAARAGFLREARAVAALKHDNVVTVFQVGEAPGLDGQTIPFLAMELLEGESLSDYLRREGRMPAECAARLGAQAADALAAAHARGVIHRDIKPGNLWLEAPPGWVAMPPGDRPPLPSVARVKVLDFGLAQPAGEESESARVLGTPAYMPPEQARSEPADARSDVFSLGVVLYELLTGQLPYPRADRKSLPTYSPPKPIWEHVPDAPFALADLIHKAIAPEPAARVQSAAEFARALTTLSKRPSAAQSRQPARRAATAGVVAVLLAAVAAGAWAWWPRPEVSQPLVVEPPTPEDIAMQPGPPDDAWCQVVGTLPPDRELAAVIAKLRELNPGYNGQVIRYGVQNGRVSDLNLHTDTISDIRPIRALTGLTSLTVIGSAPGRGKLSDISPIRGLPLTALNVWENPNLSDMSPVRGMKLTLFQAGDTAIEDITPFEGMPIGTFAVNNCRVRDLTPISQMPRLNHLRCDGCPITSLKPLLKSSVRKLTFTPEPNRGDEAILAQLKNVEVLPINPKPNKDLQNSKKL